MKTLTETEAKKVSGGSVIIYAGPYLTSSSPTMITPSPSFVGNAAANSLINESGDYVMGRVAWSLRK